MSKPLNTTRPRPKRTAEEEERLLDLYTRNGELRCYFCDKIIREEEDASSEYGVFYACDACYQRYGNPDQDILEGIDRTGGAGKAHQRTLTMDEKMHHIRSQLEQLKRSSQAAQLQLICAAFPEVVQDAEQFVMGTHDLPWEFGVAFLEGEYSHIQEKYSVQSSRHRPSASQVSPLTDLFYEACQLVFERLTAAAEHRQTG